MSACTARCPTASHKSQSPHVTSLQRSHDRGICAQVSLPSLDRHSLLHSSHPSIMSSPNQSFSEPFAQQTPNDFRVKLWVRENEWKATLVSTTCADPHASRSVGRCASLLSFRHNHQRYQSARTMAVFRTGRLHDRCRMLCWTCPIHTCHCRAGWWTWRIGNNVDRESNSAVWKSMLPSEMHLILTNSLTTSSRYSWLQRR